MNNKIENPKRGFTRGEKWLIWAVFCLLVGLSTSRLTVFLGLMLASVGISLVMKKQKIIFAIALCVIGILNIIFSKYLI